jgi:hypothetical protein
VDPESFDTSMIAPGPAEGTQGVKSPIILTVAEVVE